MSMEDRAGYNASRDGCTGPMLKFLASETLAGRCLTTCRWIAILSRIEDTGLDMSVPIGKVLASLKSYDRITTHKEYKHDV